MQYLRTAAKKLNHAPAQKEIYWVMRDYIKVRFKRWPYALKRAGLAASAGKGGKTMQQMENDQQELNSLRLEVKRKALKIGKIPHPGDLPDLYEKIRRYYNNWGEFLESAELNSEFLNQEAVYLI